MEDTLIAKKNAPPLLVRMEPSLKNALERYAAEEGLSSAAVVRIALRSLIGYKGAHVEHVKPTRKAKRAR